MSNPSWLIGHGGDTRQLHAENVDKITRYLADVVRDDHGLPANTLRPKKVAMQIVSDESGVKLISLTRKTSRCRAMIEKAVADGVPVRVRSKQRVRDVYSLDEMISIATAVMQAECEPADHRPKCEAVETLLFLIARSCADGLNHDSSTATEVALSLPEFSEDQRALLAEVDAIRLRAVRGELELHTFHGRLKLEAALRGFGLGAISKFTDAAVQTVINWGAGIKSPTLMHMGAIPKIEAALDLPAGYLSEVHVCHRSGPSNIKRYHLPDEVRAMSLSLQKEFRRLIDPTLNLRGMPPQEVEGLMSEALAIFHENRDTDDIRRARLRAPDMQYGLPELPKHLQEEYDQLAGQRADVMLMDGVVDLTRGWDDNTRKIYHERFLLFFGWLHYEVGVPLDNLSISYLAFPQVLREYNVFLIERKESVGLEKRFIEAVRESYVFARSLVRGPLGQNGDEDDDDDEEMGGWLREQHGLLKKVMPIDRLRRSDEIDNRAKIRPVLTRAEIEKARTGWPRRLGKAANKYAGYYRRLAGNSTKLDSTARVLPILRRQNPLTAIEFGANNIRDRIAKAALGRFQWATAVRAAVTLKFHAQLPLRRMTFCALTYSPDNKGMVCFENGSWWVRIPSELFKNEGTEEFENLVVDGIFSHQLVDEWGLYDDLVTYVEIARARILSGVESPSFYVTKSNAGHVSTETFSGEFRLMTREYIAENRGRKSGLEGVRPFGSHAMRHIVATAVWKRTLSLHAAAVAIHDSEKITEKHYRKLVEDADAQLDVMRDLMGNEAGGFIWPKSGEILPRISSPSSVPRHSPSVTPQTIEASKLS